MLVVALNPGPDVEPPPPDLGVAVGAGLARAGVVARAEFVVALDSDEGEDGEDGDGEDGDGEDGEDDSCGLAVVAASELDTVAGGVSSSEGKVARDWLEGLVQAAVVASMSAAHPMADAARIRRRDERAGRLSADGGPPPRATVA